MNNENIRIMEKLSDRVQNNHNTIIGWNSTINRLDQIFKPDGKFDKLIEQVHQNNNSIKNHSKQITFIWSIVSGLVLTLLILIINIIL